MARAWKLLCLQSLEPGRRQTLGNVARTIRAEVPTPLCSGYPVSDLSYKIMANYPPRLHGHPIWALPTPHEAGGGWG